jgi:hypothetical protein
MASVSMVVEAEMRILPRNSFCDRESESGSELDLQLSSTVFSLS